MDKSTQDKIDEVVNRFIGRDEMFSAFDITNTVREEGYNVYHYEARQYLSDCFNSAHLFPISYQRTSLGLTDKNGNAMTDSHGKIISTFVYHPQYDDVSKYDPNKHQTGGVNGPFKVDNRGRLCIRSVDVKKLKVKSGDMVFVSNGSQTVLIAKHVSFLPTVSRSYIVDHNNNIRVCASLINFWRNCKVKCDSTNKQLIITKA